MFKKVVSGIILAILSLNFLFITPGLAVAQEGTGCNLAITNISPINIGGEEKVSVSAIAQNITIDGVLQTATDDKTFYIWIPELGRGYDIPASSVQNGNWDGRFLEWGNAVITTRSWFTFDDPEQTYTIQLVRNWGFGVHHEVVCSVTVDPQESDSYLLCGEERQMESVLIPEVINRNESADIVVNGGANFSNQTVYLHISEPPVSDPLVFLQSFSIPVTLDSTGSAVYPLTVQDERPTFPNGNYIAVFKNSANQNCHEPRSFTLTGEITCTAPSGDGSCTPCSIDDDTSICFPYICDPETNCVIRPYLSEFEYECINKSPPTCRECEIFRGGRRVCEPMPLDKQLTCENTCYLTPDSTALRVSFGCEEGTGTIHTAIGCISFNVVNQTARFFLAWGLGIGGGIALFLIGVSGIMLATSSGVPARVEAAKSLFSGAISGLVMLALSVFLLRVIGVNVLGLFG